MNWHLTGSSQGGDIDFPITHKQERFLIGSSQTCDLILTSDGVAERHAAIMPHEALCEVVSLSSDPPLYLNGKQLPKFESRPLTNGDQIVVGAIMLTFNISSAPAHVIKYIDRYVVEKNLGQRGSGAVYLASDPELKRQVAVRLLATNITAEQIDQFRRQIEIIATFKHPVIIEVFDYGLYNERPYVVMPLLAGGTLFNRISDGTTISPDSAHTIVHDLLSAVQVAHQNEIIHGQINTLNILLDEHDKVFLSDFGSSFDSNETALSPSLFNYLSPEHLEALIDSRPYKPTVQDDLYALATVLFEMLTGQRPFPGESARTVFAAKIKRPPELTYLQLPQDVIRGLNGVLMQAMDADRNKRFANASVMQDALRDAFSGRWFLQQLSQRLTKRPQSSPLTPSAIARAVHSRKADLPEKMGRYEVKRLIGRGGMAEVLLAYDPNTRRDVALKVLPSRFLEIDQFYNLFRQEANMVAKLSHPAIASIFDYGQSSAGQPYLVMPYLPGGDLSHQLSAGPLELSKISKITNRVAAALDHAHQHSIIHLDVKPANILFDESGEAFLSDFGAAAIKQATMSDDHPAGTPLYMSPEQVRPIMEQTTTPAEPSNDVYSLGVVIFEMLTGERPFEGESIFGTLKAHLYSPIPNVTELRSGLPKPTQKIIEKALAKNAADRYHTVGELADAFQDLATGRWLYQKLSKRLSK